MSSELAFSQEERRLLDRIQLDFPLVAEPYEHLAEGLGDSSPERVYEAVLRLREAGIIRRIGGSYVPARLGYATSLVAAEVAPERLEVVAARASSFPTVTHNYEREDRYNLWFVVTAPDQARLDAVLAEMEQQTGYPILNLPLVKQFHIDLGFPLWC